MGLYYNKKLVETITFTAAMAAGEYTMKIAVLSSFTTSLFWFRVDMMLSFRQAGYEVLAVGDGSEAEWGQKFADLGIRYRQIPVSRNGTNPLRDLKTLAALVKLLREEKPDKIFAYQAKTVIYGGIAARLNGIRAFYPLIAGVGSVFSCLEDMFTKGNRRWRYAFTNCTHCGPRFTITRHLPYDRPQTSMAPFVMCEHCQAEYDDPLDRRFHAQPNACPECGPLLRLTLADRQVLDGDPIVRAVGMIRDGLIVAVKGLGGFHLVCDARNAKAVARLRERKRRYEKPLAIMVANLPSAKAVANVDVAGERLLTSVSRPIVLLPKKAGVELEGIAPFMSDYGVMLPYTPVHWLLFHELAGCPEGVDWTKNQVIEHALVMTSANPGGEPLVIDNDEAYERLENIADAWLLHDRDILIRCDDSVVRMIDDSPVFIRRARGYAPDGVRINQSMPSILACGAYLKNAAALSRGQEVFLTQHIGDLDNRVTCEALDEAIDHLQSILEISPEVLVSDCHPDFYSTRLAKAIAERLDKPLISIYHHAAHVGAVMAEYARTEPTLGLALDGVGMGPDGAIWGGELLLVDAQGFNRLGAMRPLPLPGGDRAAKEPRRMAAAVLTLLGRSFV